MPTLSDDKISEALKHRRIVGITVDTSIFVQKKFRFEDNPLKALSRLGGKPIRFVLSRTIFEETCRRLAEEMTLTRSNLRKALGPTLGVHGTVSPSREELMQTIVGLETPELAAKKRLQRYVDEANCEIINDVDIVSTQLIFDAYFASKPPFGSGKKRYEFPDALALFALQITADRLGGNILVVSTDGDWREFCDRSDGLHHIDNLERALDLVNAAEFKVRESDIDDVRTAVHRWLAGPAESGRDVVEGIVTNAIEGMDYDVSAYSTSGELEAYAAGSRPKYIKWPDQDEIEIIDVEFDDESSAVRITTSIPLMVSALLIVDLSFSLWDSIDKEYISLGSRSVEIDDDISATLIATLEVRPFAKYGDQVDYIDGDIEIDGPTLELGEVEVFEPDDYDDYEP